MGTTYSRDGIVKKVKEAFETPSEAYSKDVFDYRGSVDGVRYTEIIAEWLLQGDCRVFDSIEGISREVSYYTASHDGQATTGNMDEQSNRIEERIAFALFHQKKFPLLGEIKDYQVPLKNKQGHKAGKIDLVSYDAEQNQLNIIELKKPKSEETLLRCVLEICTYWHVVDREKLCRDFGVPGASVGKAVLVFADCLAYEDFTGKKQEQEQIRKLMKKLEVDLYVLLGGPEYEISGV